MKALRRVLLVTPIISTREGNLVIWCHSKHLFRTMMAASGESMGKSTSTKQNIQGATTDAPTDRNKTARQQRPCNSKMAAQVRIIL
ncbi:hypothetical protein HU200_030640 [Digitaria exilis]|uniref:Uncharacterized protein n=1 Tax=Digitaria exilis TaxID=1010633 RepID=A0A835EQR8_9POAL|nr:hypothetical protein HU200_030640 [Digitaria exilis]